jgi:hypothetical protein
MFEMAIQESQATQKYDWIHYGENPLIRELAHLSLF